jgi:dienelactone hydrolase
MRIFEWMLAALVVAGVATLSVPRSGRTAARLYAIVAAILFAAHAWWEGAHWQMLPIYAAILLLAWQLTRPPDERSPRIASLGAIALWAAGLAFCWVLPMFQLPAPTGPYAIGTRTLHLMEPQSGTAARELVAQLWYPAQPTGPFARYARPAELKPLFSYESQIRTHAHQDAPLANQGGAFPLLLFGHMWGGRRTQDTFLAEDLASHGFVVVALDHPGNSARVELSNGRVVRSSMADALDAHHTSSAAEFQSTWARELTVWTQDNEFALNTLATAAQTPASPLYHRLDLSRVGAFGHSFGGSASLRLLGLDPRVRSAVNMDGWTFGGLQDRTTQPILLLYEAANLQQIDPPITGSSIDDQLARVDRAAIDASLCRAPGLEAYILRAQHLDFTDQTLVSPLQRLTYTGPIPGPRMRQITRALVLAFFDQTLKHTGTLPTFPDVRRIDPCPRPPSQ